MAWYTRRCTLSDTFCGHRVFPLRQNHLHNLLLRAPLLATDSVRVDVHGDVAVGVAHENCQLPISRKTGKVATSTENFRMRGLYTPTDADHDSQQHSTQPS